MDIWDASTITRGGPPLVAGYMLLKIIEPQSLGRDDECSPGSLCTIEGAKMRAALSMADADASEGDDIPSNAKDGTGAGVVVSPNPGPIPNDGIAPAHGSSDHEAAILAEIDRVRALGAQRIRKNQVQEDINGIQVGTNRPDLQYDLDGIHHNVEFDRRSGRSSAHGDTITGNDPDSKCVLNMLGGC